MRELLVSAIANQYYQAYGQHGRPTNPYAIIHRNGADCQITFLAFQRHTWQNKPPDADEPGRRECVAHFACPGSTMAQALTLTRRRSSAEVFCG